MSWWLENGYTVRHEITDKHHFTGTFFEIYEFNGEKYIRIRFQIRLQRLRGYTYLVPVLYEYLHHNWFKLSDLLEWNIQYGLAKCGFDFEKTTHKTIMDYEEAFKYVNEQIKDVKDGCYDISYINIEMDSPCGYYYS